jgi:hypothetical protein
MEWGGWGRVGEQPGRRAPALVQLRLLVQEVHQHTVPRVLPHKQVQHLARQPTKPNHIPQTRALPH